MSEFPPRFQMFRISAIAAGALCLSGYAAADKLRPAPITFGGESSNGVAATTQPATAPQPDLSARPLQRSGVTDRSERITFAYPETAAVTPVRPAPQRLAALPAQPLSTPSVPAVTESALSAPSGVVVSRTSPSGPIRITARATETPQPVGRAVTMSRADVQRDASLTEETGIAGVYGDGFEGKPTANGEIFDPAAMTAAHPSLPLPSLVQVINADNGKEIVVRVNDRGPFTPGRIVDLSQRAGEVLNVSKRSGANVKLRYLGPAPVQTRTTAPAASPAQQQIAATPAHQPAPGVLPVAAAAAAPAIVPHRSASAPVQSFGGSTKYYIQAGAFADIGNAQRLNRALGRQLSVEIEPARVNNADYFRVLVGPFTSEHEAQVQRAQLSQAGIASGFLVER